MPESLPDFLASEATLDALITGFEDGTWPKAQWTHSAHLALGASWILGDPATALDRLRASIPRYNLKQGGQNTEDSGYHETLTCFWHGIIRDFMAALPPELDRLGVVRRVVSEFQAKRDLFRDYYDFDVVNSREARATWVPPASGCGNSLRNRSAPGNQPGADHGHGQ